jgi:DNA invertase Pin-like site-specific DNA recombinase
MDHILYLRSVQTRSAAVQTAYSYVRFSHKRQEQGDSVRRQSAAARDYCAKRGLMLDESVTYEDLATSAWKGDNLDPDTGKLAAFLRAVAGEVIKPGSVLIIENFDRLSRQGVRKTIGILSQIVDAGVEVHTLSDGRRYDAKALDEDPMAIFAVVLTAMRAADESRMKSVRVKAAWDNRKDRAVKHGLVLAETTPGWLRATGKAGDPTRRFELIPERAAIVQRMATLYLAGKGPHSIADGLNREGVECFGGGKQWFDEGVRRILANPAIAGVYEHGQERREGYFPACVSGEQWADVQALRLRKGKAKVRGPVEKSNPLAGVATCSECGASMVRVFKGRRQPDAKLVCLAAKSGKAKRTHAYRTVSQDGVFEALRNALPQMLAEGPTGDSEIDREVDRLRGELAGLGVEQDNLVDAMRRHGHSPALSEALNRVEGDRRATESKIGEATRRATSLMSAATERRRLELFEAIADGVDAGALNAQWLNVKLRAVFERIEVDPASGRMRLVWLDGSEAGSVAFNATGYGFRDESAAGDLGAVR